MARDEHVRCDSCGHTGPAVPNAGDLAALHDQNMHGGRRTARTVTAN